MLEGSGKGGGYSPADLRSAYNLPSAGGAGLTIAITIAYDYPTAEFDLATYRTTYGLPPCTSASGCFRKVNGKGEAGPLPEADDGWAAEAALDLDMASAVCPNCKILLVEADSASFEALPRAVARAAKLGADVISNSWGAPEEFPEETTLDRYFDHPGVPVLFASGDYGYSVAYPAASPDVIAVGGTSLHKDAGVRGWAESAWGGAGSGCSEYEEKPAWQSDAGCANRTTADVAAVADPQTPVSVYDTYGRFEGWELFGGTSVSAPLMAGVEGLSSAADRAKGAKLFWEEGPEGKLFDIGEGRNGVCRPVEVEYLCTAKLGYDGPTGWGTPGGSRPGPPAIATYMASDIGADEATLNGAINPNGKETTYRFEYDTAPYTGSSPHGTSVPIPSPSIGSGVEPIEVAKHLAGLTTGVTYHYRLVASNGLGTTYGRDHVLTPTQWSVQDMPFSAEQREEMLGVSCPSESDCVAVGQIGVYFEPPTWDYNDEPLVERWNGDEWARESVPTYHPPASGYASGLSDVSCSSPNACMAVGENYEIEVGYKPMVERWDGEEWSLVPVPLPSEVAKDQNGQVHVYLNSVSCVSATSCVLVGRFTKKWDRGVAVEDGTLVEKWDGTKLTIQPSPNPPGGPISRFWGVSCIDAQSCVAVGESSVDDGNPSLSPLSPLIERWDGTKWSVDAGPSLVGGLQDVSCSSADECMAVGGTEGEFGGAGIALLWNGSKWTNSVLEQPAKGVSCPKAGWCVAAGGELYHWRTETLPRAFAEVWDGSGWTIDDPPLPSDASDNAMSTYDVSCVSTACTTVGWYYSWGYQPLGERLDTQLVPVAPSVTNDPVGSVTQTTALIRAHVDNNYATDGSTCHFELALKSDANHPIEEPPCEPNPIYGKAKTPVHAAVTGLAPGTQYVYRVVAENEKGTSTATPKAEFSTPEVATGRILTVSKIGAGKGVVTSSPTRVDCGGTCTAEFEGGTEVELKANAGPETEFREWRGACSGTGACKVTMSEAREVTAFFAREKPVLTVEKIEVGGEGSGTVKARPYAVNCPINCPGAKAALYKNAVVTLTARPSAKNTFLGWGGDCTGTGTCTVKMDQAKTVTATFEGLARVAPNAQVLTLSKTGGGQGKVLSNPTGISCEVNCTRTEASFAGEVTGPTAQPPARVVLTATETAGSAFTGWTGCPEVKGNTCEASMDKARSVTANFAALPDEALTLSKIERHGEGSGVVRARPYAINCPISCPGAKAALYKNAVVTLTARPSARNTFLGWGGDCTGTGTCTVTMDQAKAVTATFEGTAPAIWRTLKLVKAGVGQGKVLSNPAGISCEANCIRTEASFGKQFSEPAKTVVLTAQSAPGSEPAEWDGCDEVNSKNQCVVVMKSSREVVARFDE